MNDLYQEHLKDEKLSFSLFRVLVGIACSLMLGLMPQTAKRTSHKFPKIQLNAE